MNLKGIYKCIMILNYDDNIVRNIFLILSSEIVYMCIMHILNVSNTYKKEQTKYF